ncbi:glycoside hydrolase family 3 C-terminal domain-containing protein [Streptomyces sp. NPDC058674]|uniref:glycoside hydrolase family 3 C-terminal domain-containing protein n=1 Tax=Streptomyces sp. NPDC058674 TaxID=3346592 RepID=UPI00365FCEE6
MDDGDEVRLADTLDLDLERCVRLLTGADTWHTVAEPAVGLRRMTFSDGPAGVRGPGWDEGSTAALLPSASALGALWDEDRVYGLGALLGEEARRKGVHVLLAPTLNLHRSPVAGRHFECCAEDPLLAGRTGAALIRGIQSRGVAATAKHYVANDSETERLTLDARLDERVLRELYLAPFEAAVRAGVWLVMSAYNKVNGTTMSESPLLAEPLKGEWGFDGVVVSDWGAGRSTVASAAAAQDLLMPGPDGPWGKALVEAVERGQVPAGAVRDKVRRLLRLAARVGALDGARAGAAGGEWAVCGDSGVHAESAVGDAPAVHGGRAESAAAGRPEAPAHRSAVAAAAAADVAACPTARAPGEPPAQPPPPVPASPRAAPPVPVASRAVPAVPASLRAAPAVPVAPSPAIPAVPAGPGVSAMGADGPAGGVLRADREGVVRRLLRDAAAASFVLLENRGALPLDPAVLTSLAVIGVHADEPRVQGGGSSEVFPHAVVTPLAGLRAALPAGVRVAYEPGPPPEGAGGPAPLGARYARDPETGAPGVRLRVLDAAGAVLHSAHQRSGRVLEPELPPGARTVELAAVLHPDATGEWTLGLGGFGALSLAVADAPLLNGEFPPGTDDPAVVHVRPPQHTARVHLTAGRPVRVLARRELAPGTGRATVLTAAPPLPDPVEALAAAVAAARTADAAVVVVGTTEGAESEGYDRRSLRLPSPQDELVREVVRANPRTVVVVNAGAPVELPWRGASGAVLLTWFPGQEAGGALADVLLGRTEPGGRLPTTWPAALADAPVRTTRPTRGVLPYEEGLHVGHRAWLREGSAPAYWFGHGLGYTTWEYEHLGPPQSTSEGYEFPVVLRNTGARRGREVVQLHLSRPDSAVERPVRWLAGWASVETGPGERVTACVRVCGRALRHWSAESRAWVREPGRFTVLAGRSAGDLPLRAALEV